MVTREPGDDQWLYLWGDGIYMPVRGGKDKMCLLVAMGTTAGGERRLLALSARLRASALPCL